MTTLKELAVMLDAATGPSREIDADLAEAVGIRIEREHYTRYTQEWAPYIYDWMGCNKHPLPHFTSSIDAALALAERLLPVSWIRIERLTLTRWQVRFEGGETVYWANAPTAPIAILKALVAALIAQEKTDEA